MSQLPSSEYQLRREKLLKLLPENSIAILPAAQPTVRNRDVDHLFRQDSNFYYLTGFSEPHAVAVFVPGHKDEDGDLAEFMMFCQDRDPEMEQWVGRRAGVEGAAISFGADMAYVIEALEQVVPELLDGREQVFSLIGENKEFDQQLMDWMKSVKAKIRSGAKPPRQFHSLDLILSEMRLIKSDAEIAVMQQAADISARAHVRAMQAAKTADYEYQLEAEINHQFMTEGSRWPAYPSIVGGGDNACILHYIENNQRLKDGDLILIDAGCELDYYAADITRTFPRNGKFSTEQKALYQLVLDAQLAAIEQVKVGSHWDQPHQAALQVLVAGLVELGLLSGDVQQLIEDEAYKPFYMHKTGHWLGMDVHDVGEYRDALAGADADKKLANPKSWRSFEKGMVLTVEPGLYIPIDGMIDGQEVIDEKWRGIGIRIEDDVVVTAKGCHILSSAVGKTVAEIEAIMQA